MRKNKAQTTLEYTMIISICAAVLLTMGVYYKRSLMGRVRGYAQQLGEGFGYSPGVTNARSVSSMTMVENSSSFSEDGSGGGFKNSVSESNVTINQATSKTEEILSFDDEKNM